MLLSVAGLFAAAGTAYLIEYTNQTWGWIVLNNGYMDYDKLSISFINKWFITILMFLAISILTLLTVVFFMLWQDISCVFKIIWIILILIILIGFIFVLLNGMYIKKSGKVIYVPDLRVKKFKIEDLESIKISFIESEKHRFFVKTIFVYKNGKMFVKDYTTQYTNIGRHRKLIRFAYTISSKQIDKIQQKIEKFKLIVTNKTPIDKKW